MALTIILGSLWVGATGYHYFENMSWLDATLNASMILTGMGPVTELKTEGGKFFAICYSMFSGMVFLTVMALVFAPIAHRLLHYFHLETERR